MRVSRLLAPVAALALLLSGCGEDEGGGRTFSAAAVAEATSLKDTARIDMTVQMRGLGLPGEIELAADGVTALAEPRMSLRLDIGRFVEELGGPAGQLPLEFRLDGKDLYVKPPTIEAMGLTDDWLAVDLREIVEAMGIDADAAGVVFTMDMASQLRAMRAGGSLEPAGTEEINGVATTHLKGSYSIDDVIEAMPERRGQAVREALAELDALADDGIDTAAPVPAELWVDDASVVHRMKMRSEVPAQEGVPAGRMEILYELSDFGAELDVSRPAGAEDITDRIVRAVKGQLVA
jgi:hypothetical protein